MNRDPVRLREDPRQERLLRDDLRAAAVATPASFDAIAGLALFEAAIRPGGSAVAAGAASSVAVLGKGTALGVTLGLIGIVGLATMVSQPRQPASRTAAPPHAVVRPAPARDRRPTAPPPSSAAASTGAAPNATQAEDTAQRRAEAKPARHPAPPLAVSAGPLPETPPQSATDDPLRRELELVSRARAQLVSSPGDALATLDTLGREVPDGALGPEREALRVLALAAVGRDDEARRRAAAYLTRWPMGPHRARIRELVEPGGSP